MNYKIFIENLCKEVEKQAGPGIRIKLTMTEKNNGMKKDVLCLEEDGAAAVPAIYLDAFYKSFQDGMEIQLLAEQILMEYERIRESVKEFSPECFLQYDQASSHIYCRLVHAERNQEQLKEIPWRAWLDLAETYYYELSDSSIPDGTIQITRSHLKIWNISEWELKCIAWENTLRDKKPVFRELGEVLLSMGMPYEAFGEENPARMYMLSNSDAILGACVVRYPGALEEMAAILDDDLYLIPSSIHEFLVLKKQCGMSVEELNQVVLAVNQDQVLPNEVLSDHVYIYLRDQQEIRMEE